MNDRFRPRTDARFVRRVVRAALDHGGRARDVSVLLCDEREIRRLHRDFLGVDRGTDVITFDLDDTVELAVSVERARRESRRRGTTIRAELALYLVHGVLHACGYDDATARARVAMRRAERAVLDVLGQRFARVDE